MAKAVYERETPRRAKRQQPTPAPETTDNPETPPVVQVELPVDVARTTLAILTQAQVPNALGKQYQGQAQQAFEAVLQSVAAPTPPQEEN